MGKIDTYCTFSTGCNINFYGYDTAYSDSSAIRPILTLKSTLSVSSGDGKTVDTAYKF